MCTFSHIFSVIQKKNFLQMFLYCQEICLHRRNISWSAKNISLSSNRFFRFSTPWLPIQPLLHLKMHCIHAKRHFLHNRTPDNCHYCHYWYTGGCVLFPSRYNFSRVRHYMCVWQWNNYKSQIWASVKGTCLGNYNECLSLKPLMSHTETFGIFSVP